jgi:hypothetical protein
MFCDMFVTLFCHFVTFLSHFGSKIHFQINQLAAWGNFASINQASLFFKKTNPWGSSLPKTASINQAIFF